MIDKEILTDELKDQLQESFDNAVNARAIEIAEEKIREATEENLAFLNEKAEKYNKKFIEDLNEKVNDYLDYVVDEFLKEARSSLENDISIERASLLNTTFAKLAESSGVDLARIVADTSPTNKNLKDKVDALTNENIKLKKEVNNLIQEGVILEMCDGLSLVEADKFSRLAKTLVPFKRSLKYKDSLDALKESICSVSAEKDSSKKSSKKLNESLTENDEEIINKGKTHIEKKISSLFNNRFI